MAAVEAYVVALEHCSGAMRDRQSAGMTLFASFAMSYDFKVHEGTRIAIGVSKNAGATWSWKVLSEVRFDDRPTLGCSCA